jgi:hypothetical protein
MRIYEMIGSIVILATLFASVGVPFSFNDSVSLYSANESSGNLTDSIGWIGDLQEYGTVPSNDGMLLGSRGVFSTANYFNRTGLALWNASDNYTITMWIHYLSQASDLEQTFMASDNGGAGGFGFKIYETAGVFNYAVWKSGEASVATGFASNFVNDTWYFLVARFNADNQTLCLMGFNGTSLVNETCGEHTTGATTSSNMNLYVGKFGGTFSAEYELEQIALWDTRLNQSDIDWLYNDGAGVTELPHTLDITLVYPEDGAVNDTNSNIYFGYMPNSSDAILNCSIYFNTTGTWQSHGAETNVSNGTLNEFLLVDASNQTLI